jgi:hypothetical protein
MARIKQQYIEERRPLFHDIPVLLKDKYTAEDWIQKIEQLPIPYNYKGWLALQVWWDLNSSAMQALKKYADDHHAFILVGRRGQVSVNGNNDLFKACPLLCEAMTQIGMIVKRCADCGQTKGKR